MRKENRPYESFFLTLRPNRNVLAVIACVGLALIGGAIRARAETPANGNLWLLEDVGQVAAGDKVVRRCVVTNDTDARILLVGSRTSCGCLSVISSPEAIEARREGEVVLQLDTRRLHGGQKQYATFSVVKHPSITEVRITLRALVRGIWADPGLIDLGTIVNGKPQAARTEFFVLSAGLPETRVESIEVLGDHPLISVDIREASTNAAGLDARVRALKHVLVLWRDRNASPGRVRSRIVITTNAPAVPKIEVPVTAHIVGDVVVRPSRIVFGLVLPETIAKRSCVIDMNRQRLPSDSAAIELTTDHPAVKCRATHIRDGRELRIEAEFDPTLLDGGYADGLLEGAVSGRRGDRTIFSIPYVAAVERDEDVGSRKTSRNSNNPDE